MGSFEKGIAQYNNQHTSKALVNFVNNTKVTHTKLGNYSSSVIGGKIDIVASGHQIFDINDKNMMNAPVTIYTPTSTTSIDKSNIFSNNTELTLKQLINTYFENEDAEIEQATKDELIKKVLDIDAKRCLIIPIKPRTDCKVTCEIGDIKKNRALATVKYLKWYTDKESYKLKCEVAFEFDTNNGTKTVRLPISDYGKSFIPDKVEYWNGVNNATRNLVEMTDLGIVKPIEITDGIQSLVVDGTFLYWLHNGIVSVVGEWESNSNLSINPETARALAKSEIFKFLKTNMSFIGGHRNLIAPYKLFELHNHNVKGAKEKK